MHVATLVDVIIGMGLTLTTMDVALPIQPSDEVGVTKYCTVPAVVLLGGAVKVWLRVNPPVEEAPVILPVIVPTVQL